jgi:hypothetical protein
MEIANVFKEHNTNYKIVISPLYDQMRLDSLSLNRIDYIFGPENVYDFSGINRFTEPVYNYYESSHYRPHVAKQILEIIYSE